MDFGLTCWNFAKLKMERLSDFIGKIYHSKNIPLQLNGFICEYRLRLNLMSNPKMIKTTCGIDRYNQLRGDSLCGEK